MPFPTFIHQNIEFLAVVVKLINRKIYFTCSYVPPNSCCSVYTDHIKAIEVITKLANVNDVIIAVGDFNMPSLSWKFTSDLPYLVPVYNNHCYDEFLNNIFDFSFYQMNSVCNEFGKLLDLVFINIADDCTIKRSNPVTLPEDRFHPTFEILFSIPSGAKPKLSKAGKVSCFKRTNCILLSELMNNTCWNDILSIPPKSNSNMDVMIDSFYKKINSFFEICVPKVSTYNLTGPPWNSRQLSRLKNLKNKYYKKFKRTGSTINYGKYALFRSNYTTLNNALYMNYLNKVKVNFVQDPKSFYKFVNSKRKICRFPSVMKFNNQESCNIDVICDMFADFFASTYSDAVYDNENPYPYAIASNQLISLPEINGHDILCNLKKLKLSTIPGPDGIPSCVLRQCAEAFVTPLTILFNASIKYGYFPTMWKDSYIIPLYKSGNRSDVTNYRGIAKLSAIPKLFEKLITDFLCHHTSSLLSSSQHGFRKGCSTTTNLLHLTTLVNAAFIQKQQTDVIYTDFSKAFDKVNHKLLLAKLDLLGFSGKSLNWLDSYLSGRKQIIRLNNSSSKFIYVPSGVPQGSHLGPLLFSLLINDLPITINFANILMYADDVKIFLSFNNYADHVYLQNDLNAFVLWCKRNMLELNIRKCKCMRFARNNVIATNYSLGGHYLEVVESFTDLGVLLDSKLSFSAHIALAVNKARGVLAFIKRWAREFSDPYVTKRLYMSLVRPILEYGSIIWDPFYNTNICYIESVQKQFLLFCLRGLRWDYTNLPSYSSRLALIKLPTLKSRRTMLNVSFMINLINGVICCEFLLISVKFNVPCRNTRHFIPLLIPICRSNFTIADPFTRLCRQYNYFYEFVDYSLNLNFVKKKIIIYLNT